MSQAEHPDRLRPGHDVTVEDVRQLMGASTPHFALQLRERIRRLIRDLPADDPARVEGEREIARLDALPGPFPVGAYADKLREQLRAFAQVQIFGELWNLRMSRASVYFELRDGRGALPCSMWRSDFDSLAIDPADGAQVVIAGGCDYYPGSATSSPSFSFRASALRVAGEGDLLAQVERLRRMLAAEGLLEPQKHLPRPLLPRTIG